MAFKSYYNPDETPPWLKGKEKTILSDEEQQSYSNDLHPDSCFCNDCTGGSGLEKTSESHYVTVDCSELCNAVEVRCGEITNYIKEQIEMINRKQGKVVSGENTTNGLQFLGIKHLTSDKSNESSKFIIRWAGSCEAAQISNKYNAVVAVKVERVSSGQRYWWTLGQNNPNLDILCDSLTENEQKWASNTLLIYLTEDEVSEKKYVHCEIVNESKTPPLSRKMGTAA